MERRDRVDLKFRLFDGTDIGPNKYDPSTTVRSLKESILAQWPKGKDYIPKVINDLKLIHAGRILENNRTLAESSVSVGDFPGGVMIMHVVVRAPFLGKNNDKQLTDAPEKSICRCTIL